MRKIVWHLLLDCRGSHLVLSWTYLDRISSLSSVHISGSPWVSQKDSPNKLDVFLFRGKPLSASSRELFKVFHYFPLVVFFFFLGIGIGIDGPSPSYQINKLISHLCRNTLIEPCLMLSQSSAFFLILIQPKENQKKSNGN